jgi:hypothetical protein
MQQMESDRKARWGRQPTRLDVERNVNKIIAIKDVMDKVDEAAKVRHRLPVHSDTCRWWPLSIFE